MKVEVTPDNVETHSADSRGRITLGSEYANAEIEVAILDTE